MIGMRSVPHTPTDHPSAHQARQRLARAQMALEAADSAEQDAERRVHQRGGPSWCSVHLTDMLMARREAAFVAQVEVLRAERLLAEAEAFAVMDLNGASS